METKTILLAGLLLSSPLINAFGDGGAYPVVRHTHSSNKHVVRNFTPGPYIKASLGAAIPTGAASSQYDKSFSTSQIFGGALGYSFDENASTDLQVNYMPCFKYSGTNNGSDYKQSLSTTSTMVNLYYAFSKTAVTPYITGGLGAAFHNLGDYTTENTPTITTTYTPGKKACSFAWQAGLGLKFKASEHVIFDLGYKYVDLGEFKSDSTLHTTLGQHHDVKSIEPYKGKLTAHEISASLIYKL